MFKHKVVFVLGAGASKEAGFPLGDELKQGLGFRLNIRFEQGYRLVSGDQLVVDSLLLHVSMLGSRNIDKFLKAGKEIHAAMPLARSIDNFLDAHRNDNNITLCGKIGIARCILEAEKNSPLYEAPVRQRKVIFENLAKTWYGQFFQLLTANVRLSDVQSVFSNVSIITFNYDRSLEQYLAHALSSYYLMPIDRAQTVVKSLEIIHPYGTVGKLSWQSSERSVPYGGSEIAEELLRAANQLQTFAEQITDEGLGARIHSMLREAGSVIFLGFAFHEINMKVLTINAERAPRDIYATAYGISPEDCAVIREDVSRSLCSNSAHVAVRRELTCTRLFDQYWRTFSVM